MMPGLGTIVSVEDSDTDFIALQFALQAAGVKNPVERCASGRAAMDSLLAGDSCPLPQKASLILLDLNLPGVDGRQLLREFRARDPKREVPVIVLSTSSHPRDIDDCYRAGADAYMVKPLELDDWETKIGSLAEFWLRATRSEDDGSGRAEARGGDAKLAGARLKKARSRSTPEHLAQLTRAIEGEIIPRLLLAHGATNACRTARAPELKHFVPCGDEVAELARLVLEQDVSIAASYVEGMRAQGATLETVFQALVAPAARLIGDLWKADLCNFNEFSEALARLQQVLAELSPVCDNKTMH
jgi:CheY-like chemotaxis protein